LSQISAALNPIDFTDVVNVLKQRVPSQETRDYLVNVPKRVEIYDSIADMSDTSIPLTSDCLPTSPADHGVVQPSRKLEANKSFLRVILGPHSSKVFSIKSCKT
jgi:hypothetical protein